MFTPENFYPVIRENFCDPKLDVMRIPTFNGAKLFKDYQAYADPSNSLIKNKTLSIRKNLRPIWMYDQEPLFFNLDNDTYRQPILDVTEPSLRDLILSSHDTFWMSFVSRTSSFPIWCTSEKNSNELKTMADNHFIPCYYWYHAFITRDWYRHWEYNSSLQPMDKSQCQYRFVLYCRDVSGTRAYRQVVLDQLSDIMNQILYNGQSKVGSELSAHIEIQDAQKSGIHIVAETLFDTDKLYLTEKVFKPMVMSQPFIVFGPPGTLEYLKNYGFRTFDEIWDESYDRETNHVKRLEMVHRLIKKLASMPKYEFEEIYSRCLTNIAHNRKWFYNQNFMQYCWKELTDSFESAKEKRKELEQEFPGGQICHAVGTDAVMLKVPAVKNLIFNILHGFDHETRAAIINQYPAFSDL